jgi:hypothetical protein
MDLEPAAMRVDPGWTNRRYYLAGFLPRLFRERS